MANNLVFMFLGLGDSESHLEVVMELGDHASRIDTELQFGGAQILPFFHISSLFTFKVLKQRSRNNFHSSRAGLVTW